MILDEATSSIDTRTESLVQGGMDKLMKGRTTFVIAHRLSTVRNSDIILVLDHGRLVEQGTYEQLVARDGLFAELAQQGRFAPDAEDPATSAAQAPQLAEVA